MTTLERRAVRYATFALALALAAGCGPKRRPELSKAGQGQGQEATEERTAPAQPIEESPDVQPIGGDDSLDAADLRDTSSLTSTGEGGPLEDVHFGYDSAALDDAARSILDKNVVWLQSHRDVTVTVEGHCDERGTVEYNLALGAQRASSVRDYLVSLGVSAERVRVVSFGKERPLDPVASEAAYARNRRAHLAVGR